MAEPERFEILILGSGAGGKLLAWHMARSGRRTAVVERRWIGGSCPNINRMPTKNEIRSVTVAHLVRHAAQFGTRRWNSTTYRHISSCSAAATSVWNWHRRFVVSGAT